MRINCEYINGFSKNLVEFNGGKECTIVNIQ